MLRSLTGEERKLLPDFYETRWLPLSRAVGPPTDPDAAFDAVKELCRRARTRIPKRARWVMHPATDSGQLSCSGEALCAHCLLVTLNKKHSSLIPIDTQRTLTAAFGLRVDAEARAWAEMHWINSNVAGGAYGRHPVELDFLDFIGIRRFEFSRALRTIACQSGIWWFEDDCVVFSERPELIVRNNAGEVSCAHGPAIFYRSGWKVFAWRNQPITPQMQTADISRMLGGMNLRESSIAIEMYGYAKFLDNIDDDYKRKVDKSKWGTLWLVQYGRISRLFIDVRNSTKLPNGTRPRYVIPVDPNLRKLTPNGPQGGGQVPTALNAIASTFGMTGEQYQNIVES